MMSLSTEIALDHTSFGLSLSAVFLFAFSVDLIGLFAFVTLQFGLSICQKSKRYRKSYSLSFPYSPVSNLL